jgi:hypothetical protein
MLPQQRAGYNGKYRGRAAVHDRCAEAPHDPRAEFQVGQYAQVVNVLEYREAGADGEAIDRRVHEEPDTVIPDQDPDDQCLECFLDERCDIACVDPEIDAGPVQPDEADRVTRNSRDAAEYDNADDPLQGYELVAVEVDEGSQEAADGQQAEQGM